MSDFYGQFATGSIPILEKALAFQEARHTLLARNIANASTPNYQPVDLDEVAFQDSLRKAVAARAGSHPREFRMPEGFREVPEREGQVRHDGNAFNVEREMTRLADNTMAHDRTVQMLASSFRVMEMAIKGRA